MRLPMARETPVHRQTGAKNAELGYHHLPRNSDVPGASVQHRRPGLDAGAPGPGVVWPKRMLFVLMSAWSSLAMGQTDEIQVYNAELAEPGEFTVELHNNYTFIGRTSPDYPGGVVPNHTLNGVPEWAYGFNDWLELGAYVAVYSVTDGSLLLESAKVRATFAVPHAAKRNFFYGVNFELSHNAERWEQKRTSAEIRPIIGKRFGPVDVIVNPILDTYFNGLRRLDFAPATRVDYNFSPLWAGAIEHYADFGQIRQFLPGSQQQQALFAVFDYNGKTSVEFGIGHGLNGATDKLVVKLMVSWSLNR
jgi:hypothetical protein